MKIQAAKLMQVFLLLAALFLSSGCAALIEDAAMRPYDKAVRDGRMTPAERLRQRDELARAASGLR
jgi:hypothetical protein